MDGIEQAIRRALAKGNDDDRAFREKVYRSAFAALDRSLKEKPELTVENAIKRRKALQATVKAIETEYVPAMAPEPAVAGAHVAPAPAIAPELRAERRAATVDAAPRLDPDVAPPRRPVKLDQPRPARERKPKRRSGRMLSLATGLVILAVLGTGVWWAYANFGHFIGADMGEIEAAINESRGQSGPPALSADGAESADAGWTTIFEPADIELVSPPEGASAEATEDEAGTYMRIRSGASGAPIAFTVGEDLLDRFAGQRVVFNIVARGIDGEGTQISVECDFGALGNCGRTRYDVGTAQEDHLFEVALAEDDAGGTSTIAINTDVSGEGRGVDIFAIRMRPAE